MLNHHQVTSFAASITIPSPFLLVNLENHHFCWLNHNFCWLNRHFCWLNRHFPMVFPWFSSWHHRIIPPPDLPPPLRRLAAPQRRGGLRRGGGGRGGGLHGSGSAGRCVAWLGNHIYICMYKDGWMDR